MRPSRSGWALASLAALSVWFIGPSTHAAWAAASGTDFPQALLGVASLLQLVLAGWVLLTIVLGQLGVTSRLLQAVTPQLMRSVLFTGAAGALAITPAHADRGTSPAPASVQHSLDGLRLPDRPDMVTAVSHDVVVRPGDTLWAIARRSLPTSASNAQIARECVRWYAANRDVIGEDPDLIHPSQRLTPPSQTPPTKTSPT